MVGVVESQQYLSDENSGIWWVKGEDQGVERLCYIMK